MRWKARGLLLVQLALIALVMFVPSEDAWTLPMSLSETARIVSWVGLAIVVAGLANLGRSVSPLPTPVDGGVLRTGGLFRFVRHPIYSGLFVWAIASASGSGSMLVALSSIALIVWVSIKARFEEKRLAERYTDYPAYAARTPRYVPFWPVGGRGAIR